MRAEQMLPDHADRIETDELDALERMIAEARKANGN